jgi:hypothetical protein
LYLESFSQIVSLYQEKKDVGSFDPMTLDTDLGAPQRTSLSPRPTVTDFILDVDLAVTRSLDEQQQRYFSHWYKNLLADPNAVCEMHVDKKVRAQLGKALIARGIYPIKTYLGTAL